MIELVVLVMALTAPALIGVSVPAVPDGSGVLVEPDVEPA